MLDIMTADEWMDFYLGFKAEGEEDVFENTIMNVFFATELE